jgi:pyridoxal/pyridoxine/pyridoxamine kinase
MKSYYVYHLQDAQKRTLAFIHDLEEFRKANLNIGKLVFTGVVVEAPDLATAMEVYNHPASEKGNFLFAEEPVMMTPQQRLETGLEDLRIALLNSLVRSLNTHSRALNHTMSRIAEQIHERSNKLISVEEIYDKMKEQALQKMSGWKYDGPP